MEVILNYCLRNRAKSCKWQTDVYVMYGRVCVCVYIYIDTCVSDAHVEARKYGSTTKHSMKKKTDTKNREAIEEYTRRCENITADRRMCGTEENYHAWQETKSVNPHSYMHVHVCEHVRAHLLFRLDAQPRPLTSIFSPPYSM